MTLLRAVCDGAVVGWGRWADVGGDVAVAGPGSGGGPGALRLPPLGTLGSCGSCGAARLLFWVTLGSIGVVCTVRGIMFAEF